VVVREITNLLQPSRNGLLSMSTVSALLHRQYRAFFRHDEWNIGIVNQPISAFFKPDLEAEVDWLPTVGEGKYLADPFGIMRDKKLYVFCEEFNYRTYKGKIVCIEVDSSNHPSTPQVVIELPFHVSYPFLVERAGEIYCIPEMSQAKEVSIFRAEQFPHKWVKEATLINDFCAYDSTVFEYGGRWWLICTSGHHNRDLFVWYADDLFGPWQQHAGNPVKRDLQSSRPGGTPFMHEGDLYRPAQDCRKTYGGQLVLNKILTLTPTEFNETIAATITPWTSNYSYGIHTISAVGKFTMVDSKQIRFIKSACRNAVARDIDRLRNFT